MESLDAGGVIIWYMECIELYKLLKEHRTEWQKNKEEGAEGDAAVVCLFVGMDGERLKDT